MEESWQDLLCRVHRAGYEDCQRERDYDPIGNEVVDAARIRAEKMECRNRELESAVKLALDLSENGLIDYKKHGLTCHDDIEQKYRNALEHSR